MERLHHLQIDADLLGGNDGLGRYVFVPGSVDRAERLAARFTDAEVHPNRRRLDVHLGRLVRGGVSIDVAAVPTGMGCPSVDIVVGELLKGGVRRLLRVGTAGSLQPDVKVGDVVVASGAVRDESASDAYTEREFPAVADPLWVEAASRAAMTLGVAERVHVGIVHSKDSFFGREFAEGPDGERNRAYMERLERAGVVASEMEAAHLFVLGQVFGGAPRHVLALRSRLAQVRCGAVCAIVGSHEVGFVSLADEQAAEERLIDLAVQSVVELAAIELG
jgi:uridine phosphorylase